MFVSSLYTAQFGANHHHCRMSKERQHNVHRYVHRRRLHLLVAELHRHKHQRDGQSGLHLVHLPEEEQAASWTRSREIVAKQS